MRNLLSILLIVSLLPWPVQAQTTRLTIPIAVKEQLQDWLTEPAGLNEELVDPVFLTRPGNLVPRPDLGGKTIVQFDTAQKQMFDFLVGNDGRNIRRADLLTDWLDVLTTIRDSYNNSWELAYNTRGGTSINRTSMRDFANTILVFGGRGAIAPQLAQVVMADWTPRLGSQYGLPNANSGVTNWTECAGDGDGDWFDEFDEGFGAGRGTGAGPDGTTVWQTADNPVSEAIETTLNTVTDPVSSTGHILRARVGKDNAGCNANANGGKQIDWTVTYREGGVTRATLTHSTLNQTTWQDISVTFTSGEADACTYSSPTIHVVANGVGGGASRYALASATEFEVPDAPGGTAIKDIIKRGIIIFPR